jgi:F-type H+-transporting ATPase subunit delta
MAAPTSRYARALADVVEERKLDVAAVRGQLDTFVQLLGESPALRNVWENPSVPAEQKRNLLDALVQRAAAFRETRNFLAVLIDRRRIAALAEIARQFQAEMNQRLGIAEAEITSARPLPDEEKRFLEAQLASLTGKKILARYKQDATLLGGAVARVGSTIYDGSLKGQLRKIKETLSAG